MSHDDGEIAVVPFIYLVRLQCNAGTTDCGGLVTFFVFLFDKTKVYFFHLLDTMTVASSSICCVIIYSMSGHLAHACQKEVLLPVQNLKDGMVWYNG